MGPLQVVIHVHNDQADTTFISDNPEVRQALENGLSTLRDKMGEAGIQLGQANVNSGGQAQQEFQRANQNRAGQSGTSGNDDLAQPEKIINSNATVRVANGLVDTFA
jgi:flagellar hook-length control protein FliK